MSGFNIVGRRLTSSGIFTGPSSPAALWRVIEALCGAPKQNALACCGLIHPKVQDLIGYANAHAPPVAPRFRSVPRKDLGDLTVRWQRELACFANEEFVRAMESIAGENPEGLFALLLQNKNFQMRFLPDELREGMTENSRRE